LHDSAGKAYSDTACNSILNEYAGKHTASCNEFIAWSSTDTCVPAYPHYANDGCSDVYCHSSHI